MQRRQLLAVSLWCKVARPSRLRGASGMHALPFSASRSRRDCISFSWFLTLRFKLREREMFCLQRFHMPRQSRIVRMHVRLLRLSYHKIIKNCAASLPIIFTSRFAQNWFPFFQRWSRLPRRRARSAPSSAAVDRQSPPWLFGRRTKSGRRCCAQRARSLRE